MDLEQATVHRLHSSKREDDAFLAVVHLLELPVAMLAVWHFRRLTEDDAVLSMGVRFGIVLDAPPCAPWLSRAPS